MTEVLEDGDYSLKDSGIWLTIRNLSVRVTDRGHGLRIAVYYLGKEDEHAITELNVSYEKKERIPKKRLDSMNLGW